jgi:hypothetical protein
MRYLDAFRDWRAARREKKLLDLDPESAGQEQVIGRYAPMVVSVLMQFIRSNFPDSEIQETGPGEWELQDLMKGGEVHTHLKIQLYFERKRPSSFLCVYYAADRMHMRQAPLKKDKLYDSIRKCMNS